jgi:alkylation response protein AidB-like acyl-CoA dehydrogenase
VPKAYGGAGVSYATLAEVIRILAEGDSSIAQITQNHLALVAHIELDGTEAQKKELFGLVLQGTASAMPSRRRAARTWRPSRPSPRRRHAVVNGQKFYTTGALLAHIVPIVADDEGLAGLCRPRRAGPDGDQRLVRLRPAHHRPGSIKIDNVRVPASRLVPMAAFDRPTAAGAISQIIQAAIDAGIAAAAIAETTAFVRTRSRPGSTAARSGRRRPLHDQRHRRAGDPPARGRSPARTRRPDRRRAGQPHRGHAGDQRSQGADHRGGDRRHQQAVRAGRHPLHAAEHNLDRHWRNARTHTLHDPVRWKYFHVGNYHLNGVNPPRHAWN